jgi:signal transduction histidine kinase
LAALRGELQLALRRHRTVEEYEVVLASSLEDVEGLISLAEDLLTLARVQGTANTAETARAVDIIQDAVHVVSGIAQMRSVEIDVVPINESLIVFGRRSDLARVLRNVIENAIAHSLDGARVRLEAWSTANTVSIGLADNGPGIPPDEQAHVFQPFFRGAGASSHNRSGAGLGLAIARGIIEAQGGSIRVDPDYQDGARFIIELPRVTQEDQ